MILRVRHETRYDYADRVELAAHVAHLRPRALPWQRGARLQPPCRPGAGPRVGGHGPFRQRRRLGVLHRRPRQPVALYRGRGRRARPDRSERRREPGVGSRWPTMRPAPLPRSTSPSSPSAAPWPPSIPAIRRLGRNELPARPRHPRRAARPHGAHRRVPVRPGGDDRVDPDRPRAGAAGGGLPGLRAPDDRRAARAGDPGAVCVGVCADDAAAGSAADGGGGPLARLGGRVAGARTGLDRPRPDERLGRGGRARRARLGAATIST